MNTRIAVIGMGLFGREVAVSLSRRGFSVLAVDKYRDAIETIKDQVDQALILDTTEEASLYEARINEMSVVIVSIGNQSIEDSIMTTALLHQLQVPRIIARAANELHARILRQVGASEVVNPEQAMGRRVAYQIASPGLREVLSLGDAGTCVAELPVPPSFVGKTLAQIDVRRNYGITVVGVYRVAKIPNVGADQVPETADAADGTTRTAVHLLDDNRKLLLNIAPREDKFRTDDTLVVLGDEEAVKRLGGLG